MISVSVYPPLIQGSTAMIGNVTERLSGLSFSISAELGYDSASIEISSDLSDITDWLNHGLGRHIEITNQAHVVIWDGFVNRISAPVGGVTIGIGPLLDISNKVAVDYSTKRYNTNPPIGGEPAQTSFADDTDSQALYSVLEEKVSGGEGTATQMEQLRDVYLAEHAYPETTTDLSLFSGGDPSISLDCMGYVHFLDRYYYTQIANINTVNVNVKIGDVLEATPNFFDSDYLIADTNLTQVEQYEDGERTALTVIKEAVSLGDSSDNRYIFGIFANLRARYSQAPTTPEYFYHEVSDKPPFITRANKEAVMPWDILPGKWLFLAGIGTAYPLKLPERIDPRNMFIERMEYTAPMGLTLSGGKVSKFAQKLARLGLGIY